MDRLLEQFLAATKRHGSLWLIINFCLIAALMISHRPDAVLHPQFWAEDGHVFYHDAYQYGAESLTYPLGGYLNSLSRLVALLAVQFPVVYAPAIFVFFAFIVQMLPPIMLLSNRFDAAIASVSARIALAYFYVVMPNCWEINLNLTDAQWHLAMVSFLILASAEQATVRTAYVDAAILVVSGLSGPFALFLLPIALFDFINTKSKITFIHAVIVTSTAVIQTLFIIFSPRPDAASDALGISGYRFFEILVNQIMLGGMIGDTMMSVIIYETGPYWPFTALIIAFCLIWMLLIAWKSSPGIFRRAVIFALLLFTAALASPYLLVPGHKWLIMTFPGHGMRYYIIPTLVWFSAILICLKSRFRIIQIACRFLIFGCFFSFNMEWKYPPYRPTNFTAQAKEFSTLLSGQRMMFPENPPYREDLTYWGMQLTKKN